MRVQSRGFSTDSPGGKGRGRGTGGGEGRHRGGFRIVEGIESFRVRGSGF